MHIIKQRLQERNQAMMRRTALLISLLSICSITPNQLTDWFRNDVLTFAQGSRNNFAAVGTCFAVSTYVARDMMKELKRKLSSNPQDHVNFLEIGAGTGPLSAVFEKDLEEMVASGNIKSYSLILIELEPLYVETLEKRFGENKSIEIVCKDFSEWATEDSYDYIVSTLPWNSKFFSSDTVNSIQTRINDLLTDNGTYTFVQYTLFGKLSRFLRGHSQEEKFDEKRYFVEEMVRQQGYDHKIVWRNIPPIHVYYLNKQS